MKIKTFNEIYRLNEAHHDDWSEERWKDETFEDGGTYDQEKANGPCPECGELMNDFYCEECMCGWNPYEIDNYGGDLYTDDENQHQQDVWKEAGLDDDSIGDGSQFDSDEEIDDEQFDEYDNSHGWDDDQEYGSDSLDQYPDDASQHADSFEDDDEYYDDEEPDLDYEDLEDDEYEHWD